MIYETDMIVSLISRIKENADRFILSELAARNIKDLKPVHGDLLLALFTHEAPTMKELTNLVGRTKSTVTTLVEKLVRLGYVSRTKDTADSRVFRVSLTPEGRALKPHLAEISRRLIDQVYKDLPMADRSQLTRALKKILENW